MMPPKRALASSKLGHLTLPCKKHIGLFRRKLTHRNRVRGSLYKSARKKRCQCIFKRTLRRKCLLLARACLLQCFSRNSAWLVPGAHWRLPKHANSLHCGNTNIILTSQVLTFSFFSCPSTLFLFYVLKCRKVESTDPKYSRGKKKKP